jgi:ABC-2 type transport system permease protein
MPLYVAVAARSFRRYSTYRAATIAGAFTNSVFGIIMCFVYLAVWKQQPDAGGYDASDAVTYVWLGQAMLAVLATFGGGAPDDLAIRIKSGDVAIDFYRPASILGWYLAADLGRAAYQLLTRGLVPTLVGLGLFDVRLPASLQAWLGFFVAVTLAVVVSYAFRMLVALTTFWLLDDTGAKTLAMAVAVFFSGMTVPLVLFPGGLREVAMALPWAAYLQVPADIWLGQRTGPDLLLGLAGQAVWAVVLLTAAQLLLRAAERRVVVQGG